MAHRRMAAAAIALSLPLAAAGTLTAQTGDPSFPMHPADAPAGTGVAEPCEPGVEGTARCGVYRVWEDRAARSGRTLDIHFIVLEALGPDAGHDDAITIFSGGPGAAMTPSAQGVARGFAPLRRARDIVLFDFRGTGRSGALTCDVPYPRGLTSRFGTVFPIDHIQACRDALSGRADLAWYTSNATIDDIEEIRRWLGYSAFNLIAGSYGTREAQIYMRRHPAAVRTAVLNGLVPVSRATYLHMAPSLQSALDAVFTDCRAAPACAEAYPDLDRRFAQVIDRLDREPPTVEVRGVRVRFSRGDFAYALRGLLYGRSGEIPYWIDQAWRARWDELAAYYIGRTDWVSSRSFPAGYHFSVLCAEDVSRADPERIARVSAGTFMAGHLIRGYWEACRVWPAAPLPDGFDEPVRSDVPTLLLSGTRDPVTPAHFAEEVARHLSNSVHVVVPGGGHGVSSPCVRAMQITLIETASVEGLDTSCVRGVERPEFRLPDATDGSDMPATAKPVSTPSTASSRNRSRERGTTRSPRKHAWPSKGAPDEQARWCHCRRPRTPTGRDAPSRIAEHLPLEPVDPGVLARAVERRRHEVGVRCAPGADAAALRGLLLRRGPSLALAGTVLGLACAFPIARSLATLVYGVGMRDPAVFLAVPAVVTLPAAVSSRLPAVGATAVTPRELLGDD